MADAKMRDADDTPHDRTHDAVSYKLKTGCGASLNEKRSARQRALNGRPKPHRK